MWDATAGMKVVCINGKLSHSFRRTQPLIEGEIYTLREVQKVYSDSPAGAAFLPAVRLIEVVNPPENFNTGPNQWEIIEVWYCLSRFRPLNKNYAIFEKMLTQPLGVSKKRLQDA